MIHGPSREKVIGHADNATVTKEQSICNANTLLLQGRVMLAKSHTTGNFLMHICIHLQVTVMTLQNVKYNLVLKKN